MGMELGSRLAELRKSRAMSQSELAKQLNISNKLVSKWERGRGVPAVCYLQDYSRIFGVTVDEILNGVECKPINGGRRIKYFEAACIILAILPYVVAIMAHVFMTDRIPAHYNSNFEVDRWGDKIELLIMGVVLSAIPCLLIAVFHFLKIADRYKAIGYSVGGLTAIVFLAMQAVFTALAFNLGDTTSQNGFTTAAFVSVMCAGCCILIMLLGVFMPIIRQNPFFGFRMCTTMTDCENWEKTHRVAMPCLVFGGAAGALGCVLVSGYFAILVLAASLSIALTIPVVYSLRLAKKSHKN